MKRILYIHHGGSIGGAPLSLLYLLQQLDRTRYEPVVVTLKRGPVVDLYRAEGIETSVEPGISDFSHTALEWYGGTDLWRLPGKLLRIPLSIRRTRHLIGKLKPDLVHLNSSTLAPAAIGCAREDVPVVWHIREPLHHGYLGLRRAWVRRTIDRCAGQVIAICQNDANQLILSNRIRVIYNFVNFDTFDRTLSGEPVRAEFGLEPDAPVVTMLGGVARPKGTLTLIRAVPLLRQQVPDVRVMIAGPPPADLDRASVRGIAKRVLGADAYQAQVKRTLQTLAQADREAILFTGLRTDIPFILAASRCLVFPSSVPHFARPIVEASALGIPSVASDLGGPRELVVHGETGFLVPPDNPSALAAALADLLRSPAKARAMGEAAYRRARVLFDARENARQSIALYDELLGPGYESDT